MLSMTVGILNVCGFFFSFLFVHRMQINPNYSTPSLQYLIPDLRRMGAGGGGGVR